MAVPSSGQLSLASIRGELTSNAYTPVINQVTHLKKASDGTISTINTNIAPNLRPDGAAPHAMSEFYGYDHDVYVPVLSGDPPKFVVYTSTPSPDPYSVTLASQSALGSVRIYMSSYGIATNGESIVGKGFVYATNNVLPTLGSTVPDTNSHDITLNGLQYGTVYYFRAWVRLSGGGIGYSATNELYATAGPVVTTQAVSSIGDNGATFTGNMTDNGVPTNSGSFNGLNSYIDKKGWLVSTNSTPTTSNSTEYLINPNTDQTNAQYRGEGSYSKAFTGLNSGTTYYVRSYVKADKRPLNVYDPGHGSTATGGSGALGYGYGNIVSFTTTQSLVGLAVTSTSYPKAVFACGQTDTTTRYFPDTSPAVGDTVYTNNAGTATLSAGHYGLKEIGSSSTNKRFTVDSSGEITVFTSC